MRQSFSDAMTDYAAFRRSAGIGKSTLANEAVVMRRFLSVNGNIFCHNITERHVTRYFEEAGKTKKSVSLQNDHGALNTFFAWARQTHRMSRDSDPMYGRRRPVAVRVERNRLHVSKFPALLDAAEEREPRDRAAIALLLYTLLRDREAFLLRVADVDLASGYIHARIFKTHQEDMIPICSELDHELRRWIEHYEKVLGRSLMPQDYLIPSRKCRPVTNEYGQIVGHETMRYNPDLEYKAAAVLVTAALEKVGFAIVDDNGRRKHEGAHTLRRSGARALFDALVESGYDHALRIVQSMLHHKSVMTTELYIGISADRRSRDELLRGKPMYGLPRVANLEDRRGHKDDHRLVV